MCITCALVGGSVNRVINPSRSKDCDGCEDRVACRKCGFQACYQRPGNTCAKSEELESGQLCHDCEVGEDKLATIRSL